MDYLFDDEHLDLVKEQVWECKEDISIYGKLSDFELEQFGEFLPETAKRSFEIGAGMGRGSIQLTSFFPEAKFTLADRQGRTENKGIFLPQEDEFYNDFEMTKSFCKLNGLVPERLFDTEEDDWSTLPKFDLITSRCAVGFHISLERYIERLISIATPDVTMIFGVNCLRRGTDGFEDKFKEVIFKEGKSQKEFPFQSWLVFQGLK